MTYEIINTSTHLVVNRIVYDGSKGTWSVPAGCIMQQSTGLQIGQSVQLVNGVYVSIDIP